MSFRSLVSTTRAALGFFIPDGPRHRFTATDSRLDAIDGAVFDSPDAAERLAEAVLAAGGGAAGQALLAALEHMPGRPDVDQRTRP